MVEYIAALHQDHDLEIDHRFMRFSRVWIEYRRQRSFTANQQNHAIDIEKSGETVPLEEYSIEEKEEGGAGT